MKKIINYIYGSIKLFFIRISIGLYNTEQEILKVDPNTLNDKNKKNQKIRTRNPLHRKMEKGQKDEKYVEDFYEVLKKGDEFLKNATPEQMERVGKKNSMSIGMTDDELANVGRIPNTKKKDKWGRRYDHFGFFDPKSKHYGKTLNEVIQEEIKQRKTNDDDYPIEIMFSNKPMDFSLTKSFDLMEQSNNNVYEIINSYEKSKQAKFPLKVNRKTNVLNKIEELTEYVHIKRVSDDIKIIEFFIPAKFGLNDLNKNDTIFNEIIDIDMIWVKDQYDNKFGYKINQYKKKVDILNEKIDENNIIYNVLKFDAKIIKYI